VHRFRRVILMRPTYYSPRLLETIDYINQLIL